MAATGSAEESDVGILCYVSELPGFRGILKQRYADFIVNEVDLDGNVVHLTSLEAPPESLQVVDGRDVKFSDESSRNYDSEIESFRVLSGDSDAELLKDLLHKITSSSEESISPIVLSPSFDKTHRTAVHNYFKNNFKCLVTDTVDGPDACTKCIRVRVNSGGQSKGNSSKKRKERGDKPFDSRGATSWPDNVGKFLRFHLYKENKDTQEALGLLGKMLGIQTKSFGFAGTKDKRAVSTQRVTVFKQSAQRLVALNKKLIGIKVGDFCYVKEGILLGQLLGNRFTVVLRDVIADSEDAIGAAADALGKFGFVNYFGLQRFGSSSVPTHLVGAALLRGEWMSALSMILDPRKGEKNDITKIREYYKESGDVDETLRQLPRYLVAERAILQSLKKYPGNHLQALKAIPRTLRMMYVHSFQSYLWNHAASVRVKKYGINQVVLGDLVYCHRGKSLDVAGADNCENENDTSVDGADTLEGASGMDLPVGENSPVKIVSSEDICSGNYTVDDVVLPLPGSRVIYPTNDVTQVFEELAEKDGINLKESVHNVKEFSIASVTGGYRRVFQKPIDFEWKLLRYSDSTVPLAETDLDIISKSKPPVSVEHVPNGSADEKSSDFQLTHENGVNASADTHEDRNSDSTTAKIALKLGLTLPSSCYATMAIRELLKTSTSVAYHKTLNG